MTIACLLIRRLLFVSVLLVIVMPAHGQQRRPSPAAAARVTLDSPSPAQVLVDTPTDVAFAARIVSREGIQGVDLVRVESSLRITMRDDGAGSDAKQGDGIYTARVPVNEARAGMSQFRAEVLLANGARVSSGPASLRIIAARGQPTLRITLLEPREFEAGRPEIMRIGVAVFGGRPQSVDLLRVNGAGVEEVVGRFEREDEQRFVLRTRIDAPQAGLIRFVANARFAPAAGEPTAPAFVRSAPIILRVTRHDRAAGPTISRRGLTIQVPAGWHVQQGTADADGALALRNSPAPPLAAGVLPPGMCEIEATSGALPSRPIRQFIEQELTPTSVQGTSAGGRAAMRAEYRHTAAPGIDYEKTAVYIPGGSQLYRLVLSHRAGDPIGPRCRGAFNLVVNAARIDQ